VGSGVIYVGWLALKLRANGDPGWSYSVRDQAKKTNPWAWDEFENRAFGLTTRLSATVFSIGFHLRWEITNRQRQPLNFATTTIHVFDASGAIVPDWRRPVALCDAHGSLVAGEGESCSGELDLEVRTLVGRWPWERPNPDLDRITVAFDGLKRDGEPFSLRFGLVAQR
jgi:hypothetical protein